MDTCDLLVPDISLRTASTSSSVIQVTQEKLDDPAIVSAQVDIEVSPAPKADKPKEAEQPEKATDEPEEAEPETEGQREGEPMEVDPLFEDVGSPSASASQDVASQPIASTSAEKSTGEEKSKSKAALIEHKSSMNAECIFFGRLFSTASCINSHKIESCKQQQQQQREDFLGKYNVVRK